jgi:hypothetical protein
VGQREGGGAGKRFELFFGATAAVVGSAVVELLSSV